jgi:hypothetical protein
MPWSSASTTLVPIAPSPATATRKSVLELFNEFPMGRLLEIGVR